MGLTDWIGAFGRAQAKDFSSDLARGYEAALLIQSIELEYYNDRPVRPEIELSVPRSVEAQVLRRFRVALQLCRTALDMIEPHRQELAGQDLRQVQLIESVVGHYTKRPQRLPKISRSPEVLPRSLIGVVDQVRRQLDPEAEASVLAGFRRRRDSTLVSLRILLLLILVPVLMQQVSRAYVFSPLVDRFAPDNAFLTYPKPQLEERAVEKLRVYREEIEFDALLQGTALPSREELHALLAKRAQDLKEEADQDSTHAIKNVLADLGGLFGFIAVCVFGQRDIQVLRSFLDELVYGLSDSAKAFAIILFTDIFVGFHSPEGWTVLLDGVANHLGLPARENFIMLFIATFPVVLATIFKYWIFRYLNRVSPSSVATLRNMNGGG
ncbi:proton extrusion protein PcxA [Synechococcus sp. CCY9201]|uniref:proton extrusion protein PcxA n=1 Tax=unclassified Synechococcus TaxID=2626047 RepID=UPI0018CE1D65|nr:MULTISPECIES: proton extrusion protein PcxA [unclassified Synechococcus]MEA5424392.1 proton extrusion protein PcxA [Synechococcus sp. CCY9202]MEA5475037.1 proton extrusion protein PcxA [Synechococcus sp. CCY9201]QPN59509.1 proton extrusion protein PcxA [Synechococcus sp. CBW1002]QPN66327.1 proton extrusion protein PcxA [Synechococcus sp. CBW1006]CAK6694483.1 envelope membrane protein, chloroplastic [Synechococcus sp. CBW1107]